MTVSRPEMITSQNKTNEIPPDRVEMPFRGTVTEDHPGSFHIYDRTPSADAGWDIKGEWDIDADHGIVVLEAGLTGSMYVADGDGFRLRSIDEPPRKGIRSSELRRLQLGSIRSMLRSRARAFLDDPFFAVDDAVDGSASKTVSAVRQAASAKPAGGRPPTSPIDLDMWATDVIRCISDPERGLYEQLIDIWHVGESTIKNHRLPALRAAGRISGRGKSIVRGPNYPSRMEKGET